MTTHQSEISDPERPLRATARAVRVSPEVAECPACGRIVSDLCGDSVLERSWFQITSQAGLCPAHNEGATTGWLRDAGR